MISKEFRDEIKAKMRETNEIADALRRKDFTEVLDIDASNAIVSAHTVNFGSIPVYFRLEGDDFIWKRFKPVRV